MNKTFSLNAIMIRIKMSLLLHRLPLVDGLWRMYSKIEENYKNINLLYVP